MESSRSNRRPRFPICSRARRWRAWRPGIDVELVRQPIGVVAAITPFNFPAMIPLWFLPYAVACGNAFILKPSERDPRPSQRICELIAEEEIFPPGVVNLVHGGREAVESILAHEDVDAVSFVGQASTARLIATRSAETGKRVQALGGAKNSMIVADDADLSSSVPAIMASAFGAAGQRCLAGSVCVVVGDREPAGGGPRPPEERRRGADHRSRCRPRYRRLPDGHARGPGAGREGGGRRGVGRLRGAARRPCRRRRRRGDARSDPGRGQRPRIGAGPRGDLRPGPGPRRRPRPGLRDRLRQRLALRQRRLDLHHLRRGGPRLPLGHRGGNARGQHRRSRPGGVVPLLGWKDSIDGDLHANGSDAVDFYTRKKVVTSRW